MVKSLWNDTPKVVLVELPGVQLTLAGAPLSSPLLHYPKYPQLMLASAVTRKFGLGAVSFVDLKGNSAAATQVKVETYGEMVYEGLPLSFQRVGLPTELLDGPIADAGVIGISCNYSMERGVATELLRYVRLRAPRALILVGGHDASVVPQPYLAAGADYCVLGEGETVLLDILSCRSHAEIRSMRGVAFLQDGRLRRTGKRPALDMDRLRYPPPQMILGSECHDYPDGPWPVGVGTAYAVLETSRGCDEACSFCSSTFVSGRYRGRSIDGILEQLREARAAGISTLLIADDNLLYRMLDKYGGPQGRDELVRLFIEMARLGFSWTFYNGLQFGLLEKNGEVDIELIEALFWNSRNSNGYTGCFEAYIPLERFKIEDRVNLTKLREPATQRKILQAIARQQTHQLNMGFIVGKPSDSIADLWEAASEASQIGQMILEHSVGRSAVSYLPWCSVPLPGTPDRSAFRSQIRYDLDAYPELHSNYISVVSGTYVEPLGFTRTRAAIDARLNRRSAAIRAA